MTSFSSLRSASRAGVTLSLAVVASVLGCRQPAPQAPPPPEVSVVTVQPRTVDDVPEFVGSVVASRSVPVRAQVGGVIVARPFTEGAAVRAGEVLYRIDPRTYEAACLEYRHTRWNELRKTERRY